MLPKIEFYQGQNMEGGILAIVWRRAFEVQVHGIVGLLHGVLG